MLANDAQEKKWIFSPNAKWQALKKRKLRKEWKPCEDTFARHRAELMHLCCTEQQSLRARLIQAWQARITQRVTMWKESDYDPTLTNLSHQFDPDTGWFWDGKERKCVFA